MGGKGDPAAGSLRAEALDAFARCDDDALGRLRTALLHYPQDGALLIAEASAAAMAGRSAPFERLEAMLDQAPDWVEGHKALVRLRAEHAHDDPLAVLEAALERLPRHPKLWMAYVAMLAARAEHRRAADIAAKLRRDIADLPPLRLLEARHAGFAGQQPRADALLRSLPEGLREAAHELARHMLRTGDLRGATAALDRALADDPADIGSWALAELAWRASGDERHQWLLPKRLFGQFDLGLSSRQVEEIGTALAALHTARGAPLGQTVVGGTQTRGDLRMRPEPEIAALFAAIRRVLADYTAQLAGLGAPHPLTKLAGRAARITASWSIRLVAGGHHVSHLHDHGLISSAAHVRLPDDTGEDAGVLELGRPPADIPLDLEPVARFAPREGHLVLFPSFLYHGTTRFARGERISVAFDAA